MQKEVFFSGLHSEHFWRTYRFAITLWRHFPQLYVQKIAHPERPLKKSLEQFI